MKHALIKRAGWLAAGVAALVSVRRAHFRFSQSAGADRTPGDMGRVE